MLPPETFASQIVVRRKRQEAARARRMALYLANGDKRLLFAYAEELEAEADRLERENLVPADRSRPAQS